VSFDGAGVVGEGEAVTDGVVVGVDAADEGVEFGLVVGLDRRDPGVEVLAVESGEHLGEGSDVEGESVQVGAARPNVLKGNGFGVVEGVGVAQDEVGDLPPLRRPRCRRAGGVVRSEAGVGSRAGRCSRRGSRGNGSPRAGWQRW
jgi:hypothetical protein